MHKPESLRRVLVAHVPGLSDNPDRLAMFVDRGRIVARATGTLSFAYAYTLNLVVEDYAGTIDALMIPILAWIAEEQPDLLETVPNEPLSFEQELLDAGRCDISIDIALTERVRVVSRDGGGWTVEHLRDRPVSDTFAGVCGAILRAGYANGDPVAPVMD